MAFILEPHVIIVWSKLELSMSSPNTAKTEDSQRPFKQRKLPQDPPEHRSIILDGIHPREFRELNIIYCCEQCSYFNTETHKCAIGFHVEKHRRENQLKLYNLTGKMALCRSQEVD